MSTQGTGGAQTTTGAATAEDTEHTPDGQGTVTRNQSLALFASSIMTAIAALGVTVIAKHFLEGTHVTEFLLFWSVLYSIIGVISGIQPEVTRAVGAARRDGVHRVRVVYVTGVLGLLAGTLVVLTSPLWAPGQVPTGTAAAVGAIAAGVAFYALQASVSGASAGHNSWYLFAGMSILESAGRLAFMVAVAVLLPTLTGMEIAAVAPILLWVLPVLVTLTGRKAWAAKADIGAKKLSINLSWSFLSSGATAALMMGFPAILNVSEKNTDEHTQLVMAALILAISITRSPIMIPLLAFQGVAVSAFLKQQHRPVAAFMKPAALLLGVGAVGAAVAYCVGSWLFRLIYPPKPYENTVYAEVVTGTVLAALVFASAMLALIMLSGSMMMGINRHRFYAAGWVVAAAVAINLAFLAPLPLVGRAIVALYAGPICGFAVHLIAMLIHARAAQLPTEGESMQEIIVENTNTGQIF